MGNNFICTVILPSDSLNEMTSNIADLSIYNISVYNSVREITREDLAKSDRVVVVGKIDIESVSDLKLHQKIWNLKMYYIGSDELICSMMSEFCEVYTLDYTKLDQSMLMSIFYKDKNIVKTYGINPYNMNASVSNIAENLLDNPDKNVSALAKEYKLLREFLENTLGLNKNLKSEIHKLESTLLGMYSTNESLVQEISRLVVQYSKHHNELKNYKIMFTEDIYDSVNLGDYKKKPKIIYFKEYSEFLHLESFIDVLTNIISLLMKSSVKVIRLHDSCDVNRIRISEDRYVTTDGKFLVSEVIKNDIIMCYGNYLKLFDTVLNSPLDYLIVVDCKKFDNVVLIGDYLKLNLCRNPKDLDKLNLAEYITIVNNSDSILSWDTYERYNEFETENDKFVYLSSRPVMKKLFELIEDIV